MTTDPTPMAEHDVNDPAPTGNREADLALAGVHLRLGLLALARAELETLAAARLSGRSQPKAVIRKGYVG